MLANRDIICISDLSWDAHWSTEQQFMSRLCKSNRVLYVNQPITWLTPMKGLFSTRAVTSKKPSNLKNPERRYDRLYVASLPPLLPFRYSRLANVWNTGQYVRHIKRWARELDLRSPILWIYEPSAYNIPKFIDHSFVIYHCLDCWTGHDDWWNSDNNIARCEKQLVIQSDLVITVSESLYHDKARLNPNTHFVPNGADYSHFSKSLLPDTQIPKEMQEINHPIIGFIGMIGTRFDAATLQKVAKARPDWSIVLIGEAIKKERSLALLVQLPNVHFLGMQPIEKLPSYLKAMDVCLIPYKKNSFTDNCFPLKFFEYLSAGKPIVASSIPSLNKYPRYVYLSNNTEEYLNNIELALTKNSAATVRDRVALAEGNSWDARLREIGNIIDITKGLARRN